jgi:dTDP-glucose pyrophosphorylase
MQHIKDYLITTNSSIKEAIKQIEKNEEKIVFVIDENNKLLGSLTDGDVRRWILNDGSINVSVLNACHKNPISIQNSYIKSDIIYLMESKRIFAIPIVDEYNQILDILFYRKLVNKTELFENKELDADVVIMAGGKGTRLEPFTKIVPKPLIPIDDKTILEHLIEKFSKYNIHKFYITINYKAELILAYFKELNPNYKIHFVREIEPLGTIGSLKLLPKKLKYHIIVVNCDILINEDYSKILKFHADNKNDITLVASLKHFKIPYGVCKTKNGDLVSINEKPEYDFLVNTGFYIINKPLLELIPDDIIFHATDLFHEAKEKGYKIGVFPISDTAWIDIGEWEEYKKSLSKISMFL